jgi:putative MFS transporter
VGSLVSGLAAGIATLVLGRVIVGVAIGADLPVSTTLIAEVSPTRRRGTLTGLMQGAWFAGSLASTLVAIALYTALGEGSWRWMLASGAVLALVVLLLRLNIRESPRWERIRGVPRPRLSTLLRPPLRAPLVLVALFWFLVTVRGAGFVIYTPTLLSDLGVTSKLGPLWMSAILFLTYTAVAFGSALVIDRFSRRSLVLRGWALATALTIVMAFVGEHAVAACSASSCSPHCRSRPSRWRSSRGRSSSSPRRCAPPRRACARRAGRPAGCWRRWPSRPSSPGSGGTRPHCCWPRSCCSACWRAH